MVSATELHLSMKRRKPVVETESPINQTWSGTCCACPKSDEEVKLEEEERQMEIEFENFLHDSVYIKRWVHIILLLCLVILL